MWSIHITCAHPVHTHTHSQPKESSCIQILLKSPSLSIPLSLFPFPLYFSQVPLFNGSSYLRFAPLGDTALIWLELKVSFHIFFFSLLFHSFSIVAFMSILLRIYDDSGLVRANHFMALDISFAFQDRLYAVNC